MLQVYVKQYVTDLCPVPTTWGNTVVGRTFMCFKKKCVLENRGFTN